MSELESKIDSLLNSYEKTHQEYKFKYLFYNLSQTRIKPLDFPQELWNRAIEEAPSVFHMPVILKGFDELEERVKKQSELLKNINESTDYLYDRFENVNKRCEALKNKINETVKKCRNLCTIKGKISNSNDIMDRVYKLRSEMYSLNRKSARVEDKNSIGDCLWNFKLIGEKIKKELDSFKDPTKDKYVSK